MRTCLLLLLFFIAAADPTCPAGRSWFDSGKTQTTVAGKYEVKADIDAIGEDARFSIPKDVSISFDMTFALVATKGGKLSSASTRQLER